MSRKKDESELLDTASERRAKLMDITKARVGAKRGLMGDDPKLHMETIETDIPGLDDILAGGWRRGRMGMVIGEASMGKTLIMQWTIRAFQQKGYVCGFIDPEKTFDAEWFEKTGVNTSELLVVRPTSTEQAFDLACDWAANGMDFIGIDSLAALVPVYRLEHDLEEKDVMGLHARKVGEGLAQLTNRNWDSFILCTNQLRSKLGIVYGSPDEIPGGRAQKFYASYILKVRRAGWVEDNGRKVGYNLNIRTIKNKLAPPEQECQFPFMFTGTIDTLVGLLELAKDLNIIPVGKGGYAHWKGKTIHGAAKLREHFEENPADVEELTMLVETNDSQIDETIFTEEPL
ncbi:hypothetical protein LCGC14_0264970 [marine sediment metagenome]|uniref:RecA family profile 2 domain-containing protein n=1 Tax=marine sediment metagenome TaxID=412755 RepID=A0A0F9U5Q2_9ZZZZ